MSRKLKMLGLAFVAVLALAALLSSAASAANYTASSYPTTGTAESALGNDVLTTEAGKVECKSHFEGTLSSASSSLTVVPKYTGCKAFGFLEATVTMNSCDYPFTEPTGSSDSYSANLDISCPFGKVIEVTAGTCKMTIGAQTGLSSVAITNNTGAGDVTVKANVTEIHYTVTQDGFGCSFSGTGGKFGATYIQSSAVTFDATNAATLDVG
jgi:hypothetical protein